MPTYYEITEDVNIDGLFWAKGTVVRADDPYWRRALRDSGAARELEESVGERRLAKQTEERQRLLDVVAEDARQAAAEAESANRRVATLQAEVDALRAEALEKASNADRLRMSGPTGTERVVATGPAGTGYMPDEVRLGVVASGPGPTPETLEDAEKQVKGQRRGEARRLEKQAEERAEEREKQLEGVDTRPISAPDHRTTTSGEPPPR